MTVMGMGFVISIVISQPIYGESPKSDAQGATLLGCCKNHRGANLCRPSPRGSGHLGREMTIVREGQIVPFSHGIGAGLCEQCRVQTLHEHHALLVEHHGTQRQLFGEADTEHQTARKSFFRRMYENAHPENAINFEIIFCMQKEGE